MKTDLLLLQRLSGVEHPPLFFNDLFGTQAIDLGTMISKMALDQKPFIP